jgi:Bardet-Biedl syndrome 2 protein
MLRTVFSFSLCHKIIPKVAIGKFDGEHPSLVAATVSDKVIWHNPQNRGISQDANAGLTTSAASDVFLLNINQTIQSIATGSLVNDNPVEYLVIGTPSSIFVYDVQNNRDVFYRDIADGANAVVVGRIGSGAQSIAIAGGNCAIQGFTADGQDAYWTVTGDMVTSLTLYDVTDDGQNELIVGSEDYDITVFRDEAILYEVRYGWSVFLVTSAFRFKNSHLCLCFSETDVVTCVCGIYPHTFGYALMNGTVGVYHKQERIWRIKSKNRAAALAAWDINGDGIPELVTGWTSGKIDARSIENGDVVFKDTFSDAIAAIFACDYNMDGVEELVVVSVDGEVRGYQRIGKDVRTGVTPQASRRDEEVVRELMRRRQSLVNELAHYEEGNSEWGARIAAKASGESGRVTGIPADTQIKSTLMLEPEDQSASILLTLSTSNETIIRTAVIFAEGIFRGESFVIHSHDQDVDSSVKIALRPQKDMPIDLHIKVIVGQPGSSLFHVFELTRRLPPFSMYALVPGQVTGSGPSGKVTFTLNESASKLIGWFNKNFIVQCEELESDEFDVTLLCLRDASLVHLMHQTADEEEKEFVISTDNMELAGQIVQSLVSEFLCYTELRSIAHFPKDMQHLRELVSRVDEIQSVRQQLAADIAENSSRVRGLVIRSEDARLLSEFRSVRQFYSEINSINRDLMKCYSIRHKNQEDLVSALKQINLIIQKTANLRVGKPKTDLVQACRQAIRQTNLNNLVKIISSGSGET